MPLGLPDYLRMIMLNFIVHHGFIFLLLAEAVALAVINELNPKKGILVLIGSILAVLIILTIFSWAVTYAFANNFQ
jgi:hypothetical protein